MRELDELLALSAWMQDLTAEQRERVRTSIHTRDYASGEYICRKGSETTAWLGVVDGLVRLGIESRSGKQLSFITGIPGGSWFGEGSLLKREQRKYDVVAIRPSRIAFFPAKLFFELLDESVPLNRFLLNHINERLAQFINFVECDRLLTAQERVARSLATMFNYTLYPGAELELHLSQEELGHLAGVSRQRVNQALKALQEARIVEVQYGVLRVLDPQALAAFESDPD